jgi:ketosteroid isomerase-like protein
MRKSAALLVLGLTMASLSLGQEPDDLAVNPEMQREEIVNLEKEAARAIQLNDPAYFRRVYSDDFAGTLSHGQQVDRSQWINTIQSPDVKYESFTASDIKVRIYKVSAIATCLWSVRSIIKGQRVNIQIRAMHVYINTPRGWHVIAGQTTNLPPDVQQPL